MSWNFAKKDIPKADAHGVVHGLHAETHAYQNHPVHRRVMDVLTQAVREIANVAPDGTVVAVESGGHYNDDGTGSMTLKVSAYPPVAAAEPKKGAKKPE
jgi:hypothetical protein